VEERLGDTGLGDAGDLALVDNFINSPCQHHSVFPCVIHKLCCLIQCGFICISSE
jgi:hypothetical protein